jgi:hypothetical protein
MRQSKFGEHQSIPILKAIKPDALKESIANTIRTRLRTNERLVQDRSCNIRNLPQVKAEDRYLERCMQICR